MAAEKAGLSHSALWLILQLKNISVDILDTQYLNFLKTFSDSLSRVRTVCMVYYVLASLASGV